MTKKRRILNTFLAACMVTSSMIGMSVPASAEGSTFSIVIPATLTVENSGWNSIGNISATGTLESGKKLTVTAASTNDWKLVSGTNNVSYTMKSASTDTEATTSWEFTELSSTATTKPIGIDVEDYSTKPAGTYIDTVTFTASVVAAATDLAGLTGNYVAQDGDTITGTVGSSVKISIADGATVTLNNVSINADGELTEGDYAGITCEGDATIILQGTNTVKGLKNNYAGIYIASGKTLTIEGDGILNASSKNYGAGIGAGWQMACGNIVINSGNITATGGGMSASIGGGYKANCGNITINGGTVNATGTGTYGIGIGGGYLASCGDITIANTVTKVTATRNGDGQRSIGKGVGNTASCGTITIGGVVTEGITESPYTYQP